MTQTNTLLYCDRDARDDGIFDAVTAALEPAVVITETSGEAVRERLSAGATEADLIDYVVTTNRLPDVDMAAFLEELLTPAEAAPVGVLGFTDDVSIAATACTLGAEWYLSVPDDNSDEGDTQALQDQIAMAHEQAREISSSHHEPFHTGLDALGEIFYELDASGRLVRWNDQLPAITGLDHGDLAGTSLQSLVVPADRERVSAALESVQQYGAHTFEVDIQADSGTVIPHEFSGARLVAEDGSYRGVVGIGRDVRDRQAQEQELNEATERYEAIVEQSQEGIHIVQNGVNVFVNDQFCSMTGYDEDELLGAPFYIAIAPEYHDLVKRRHEQRLRGEDPPSTYDLELETKDGERLLVALNVSRIQYGGEPATLATHRDITDRKEHERELARFKRATEAAGQAIFRTDTAGTITYVNPAFETITGYSEDEAIGQTPRILKSGEMDGAFYADLWETITAGEQWENTIINEKRSGEYYHAQMTIAPVSKDGDIEEFVAIQTDITQRVEQNRQVRTLDRVLRHNLRNKLSIIGASAERIRTEGSDSVEHHVETITDEINSLSRTADKARELSTFLAAETARKPIDVVRLLNEVAAEFQTEYPAATVEVVPEEPVLGNAVDEINRAVRELVENALEHNNGPDTTVTLDAEHRGEMIDIKVADDGPGIPPDQRDRIFEEGEQGLDSDGTGLGLYLVQTLVDRYEGEVWVADNDPEGVVFVVELDVVSEE